jgi:hypothetical protein
LAARGDLEAVRELADLISLSAQIHAESGDDSARHAAAALWLAATVAIAAGAGPGHQRAKEALRAGDPDAPELLLESAEETARQAGLTHALVVAADSVGLDRENLPNRG